MAVVNPDDPTIPVGSSDVPTGSKVEKASDLSSGNYFMNTLTEAFDLAIAGTIQHRKATEDIARLSKELGENTVLSLTENGKLLDQLADAADRIDSANKSIDSAKSKVGLLMPDAVKDALIKSPLVFEAQGVKVTLTYEQSEMLSLYRTHLVVE